MFKGYLSLILNMHLPFVRHPENDSMFEEKWLFEAISESYIPLIGVFGNLINEKINFRLTISMTPSLISMLNDELLQKRYKRYLESMIELTEKEVIRTKYDIRLNELAKFYNRKYKEDYHKYVGVYKCDLIGTIKSFQESGTVEIIAGAATHGFLPVYETCPKVIDAQVGIGVKTFLEYFQKNPKGIWLPECGYVPVIEKVLGRYGIKFIVIESHGLLYANPRPVYSLYRPIVTPNGIVAFGRDTESAKEVWSAETGYPGDRDYRDFYRDIGYDLDFGYIKNYISRDGQRVNTGIKYHRITGKTNEKKLYNPEGAVKKAGMHATDFMNRRIKQAEYIFDKIKKRPVMVCPFDAELFGHWWYEGPVWLDFLLRKLYFEQDTIRTATLSEYLEENPVMQISNPNPSSWGCNGYSEYWLNGSNDWIYRHLHKASERMTELADSHPGSSGITRKALNQAARELLLAQSSDWAFIMKSGTMVQYAIKRTKEHLNNFTKIYNSIKECNIDESWLNSLEQKNNIFPKIDYRIFSSFFNIGNIG
ncbi:MAG TPA: DUF1957 domain-containing protein [Clostridiaceae bacterium]|nr:DUF1957 domain-containing protein [Clostridiaceae bacterium]